MRSMEWEKYYYFFEMAYNVPGAGDVAPDFGAQCGEAQATDRERRACPVLYAVRAPTLTINFIEQNPPAPSSAVAQDVRRRFFSF